MGNPPCFIFSIIFTQGVDFRDFFFALRVDLILQEVRPRGRSSCKMRSTLKAPRGRSSCKMRPTLKALRGRSSCKMRSTLKAKNLLLGFLQQLTPIEKGGKSKIGFL